jgi:uncharacterized membrane protein
MTIDISNHDSQNAIAGKTKMRTAYKIATYLVIAVGVVHIALSPVFFGTFTMRVMWFISMGMMGIFLGFLNVAFWRTDGRDGVVLRLSRISNLMATAFAVFYIFIDRDPQNYIGLILFLFLTTTFFLTTRGGPHDRNKESGRLRWRRKIKEVP